MSVEDGYQDMRVIVRFAEGAVRVLNDGVKKDMSFSADTLVSGLVKEYMRETSMWQARLDTCPYSIYFNGRLVTDHQESLSWGDAIVIEIVTDMERPD